MIRNYSFFSRTAGLLACVASVPMLCAAAAPAEAGGVGSVAQPTAVSSGTGLFHLPLAVSSEDFRYHSDGVSSSTSDSLFDERASLAPSGTGALQPPTRRRSYGRSRYQDRRHNADGSSKIAIMAGAGMAVPVGNTGHYYTPGYNIAVGAGINFNKMFGILGEYHYDHFGLTGGNINNQLAIYTNELNAAGQDPTQLAGLDANAHVNSITVDPIINFSGANLHGSSKVGAYVTGGVGYYRKSTNFTLPQVVSNGFFAFTQNTNIATYSANALGANFGAGLSYALSEFSSERLFVEARYNWLKISSNNNPDDYLYNRRNSEYVPITVGIRF